MPVRLFVGNLPYDTTEAELREHFSAVGALSFAQVAMDRETGRARGFAFIEFADPAQAEEAIRRFNNQPFKNRPLAINEARPKDRSFTGRASSPSSSPPPFRRPAPPNTDWIKDSSMAEPPLTKDFDSASRRSRKPKGKDDRGDVGLKGVKRKKRGKQISWDDEEY